MPSSQTTTPTSQPLDPSIVNLAQAISKTETQGQANPYTAQGGSGEYGAYQYTAPTWAADSQKYLGQSVPLDSATPAQQDEVAYDKIQDLGKQGYSPAQIASIWNSGNPDPTGNVGVNKYGVKYDTPQYVKSVETAYNQLRGGQQVNTPPTSSTVGDEQTGTPNTTADPNAPNTYGATFPASPSDTPLEAGAKSLGNIPSSALNLGENLATAVEHPVKTVGGIVSTLLGVGGNIAQTIAGAIDPKYKTIAPNQFQQTADAVGKALTDRYGSLENAQRTATNDPIGFGTDVLTVLEGGAGALDAAAGTTAEGLQATDAATNAERFLDTGKNVMPKAPESGLVSGLLNKGLSTVAQPVVSAVKGVASIPARIAGETAGIATGAGYGALKQGFNAATTGGDANTAFLQGLRGNTSPEELVSQAHDALDQIQQTRNGNYQQMLSSLGGDAKTYDISPVINEVNKQLNNFGIKKADDGTLDFSRSKIRFNTSAQADINKIYSEMKSFGTKAGDRTALGVNDLKQAFYDLDKPSSSVRSFTTAVSKATRGVLENAPGYSKAMSDYSNMSDQINDIRKGLSLGDNAMVETTFKKLTSALRQNNDFRKQFIQQLDEATGGQLSSKIAGQQLSTVLPRGLIGTLETAGGIGGLVASGGHALLPLLATAITTSPRVVGEVIHALGLGARGTNAVMDLLNKIATPSTIGGGLLNHLATPSGNAVQGNQNVPQRGLISSGVNQP